MIYVDNNATTKIDEAVLEAMRPYLEEEYGNPGSRFYTLATNAEKAIETSREQVAALINAKSKEIIFTSSGSESNNFIIKGMSDYLKNYEEKGNHIVTSVVEHKSVINSFKFLDGQIYMSKQIKKKLGQEPKKIDRGYDVNYINVNSRGQVAIKDIKECINKKTILGSFIWANNETGNLNDIDAIVDVFKNKEIFLHSDATQMVGKLPVDMEKTLLDAISFSAHKIYGPKGIGAAYLRSNKYTTKDITSLIHGGTDQELGYRAGTAAVHNIVGFGMAAELARLRMKHHIKKLEMLESEFIKILTQNFKDVEFLIDKDNKIPGVISFILPGVNNQIYLRKLSNEVAFSSGSACTISTDSNLLDYLGKKEYKANFFRVAFGKNNEIKDLKQLKRLFV